MSLTKTCLFVVTALLYAGGATLNADITDFTNWSLVQDPPDANFTSSVTATQASLFAGAGAIPLGTDIGFVSINGNTAASSTAGYVFDPDADFLLAIDYDLSFVSASGALGLGFGIGEDVDGMNSAGVAFITNNGSPFLSFGGVARVNDVTQPVQDTGLAATLNGSMFVGYDAATGDLILGASQTAGDATPSATTTFAGLQNFWNGDDLLASFFIRSEAIPFFAPNGWNGGDGTAVFSNFRVLQGSAKAIPEPGSTAIIGLFAIALLRRRR